MNKVLDTYARKWLKEQMFSFPESWQIRFIKMYGKEFLSNKECMTKLKLFKCIDNMDSDKLDHAMQLIINANSLSAVFK